MTRLPLIMIAVLALGCAPTAAPHVPAVRLASTQGAAEHFPTNLTAAAWTVLVFFSADCPCFRAHEDRLRSLRDSYGPRGVRFLLVDSESDASLPRATALSRETALAMPVVVDSNAVLADALGAEYATYSVVLGPSGVVHYHGGLDSDKSHLRADATFYLREALDDLLSGRRPRRVEAKALGCPLQTR